MQQVFEGERFPNVVVTTDGTVLATWGRTRYVVRRSEDGGVSWGPEITVSDGIAGWGHGGSEDRCHPSIGHNTRQDEADTTYRP